MITPSDDTPKQVVSITVSWCGIFSSIIENIKNNLRPHIPLRIRSLPRRFFGMIGDHMLGISAEGWYYLKPDDLAKAEKADGHMYQAATYASIRRILRSLPLEEDDVFVDLGCGKGRIVCYVAAKRRIRKVVGVELVAELVEIAKHNASRRRYLSRIEIENCDVTKFAVDEGTVFFLYDPFGPETVNAILDKIEDSLVRNGRRVFIVCFNLPYADLYDRRGWLFLYEQIGSRIAIWKN